MFTLREVAGRSIFRALVIWVIVTSLVAESCLHCKQKPNPWPAKGTRSSNAKTSLETASQDELLSRVESISTDCISTYQILPVDLPTDLFDRIVEKVDLITKVLGGYFPYNDQKMLFTFMEEIILSDASTSSGRLLWFGNGSLRHPDYFVSFEGPKIGDDSEQLKKLELDDYVLEDGMPWMETIVIGSELNYTKEKNQSTPFLTPQIEVKSLGNWSEPYFFCEENKWIVSFTSFIVSDSRHFPPALQSNKRIVGLMSVDVDVTDMDINQCDALHVRRNASDWQMSSFLGTHKCNNRTSRCIFTPGYGWTSGSYKCQCRDGFYSPTGNPVFNGSLVEAAYKDKIYTNSPIYDMLYVCKKCQPGCDACIDNSPCLSHYNWAFRISFLTISVICILLTMVLSVYVYHYRKLKVIKVASPVFLCITLLGCVIMYCEMAAIFPVLDMYSCIATKWTRHMGFCITYSALLLKTWRVSLTYRVKSAHKLKLTDKQLLQWLFPILLVMAIYLGTWTISSPPAAVYIKDWHNLKFKQCDYNWWDHSLAIGEFLFLLWGIRVCYNVRNAESFFNEAKHISWAVHSITIVNIIMVMIHLVILPNAGPDVKYLFGFFRTQLSTTITVILIFGPKFYRVIKGEGDTWDNRARARGVTASFSLNGVGPVYEEPQDLYQENEELKEEVQKLASQIEFMRIVHMEVNNRHLKPKHGSFFSQPTVNQSPIIKNMYMKFESTDSPGSKISAAAELVSERV